MHIFPKCPPATSIKLATSDLGSPGAHHVQRPLLPLSLSFSVSFFLSLSRPPPNRRKHTNTQAHTNSLPLTYTHAHTQYTHMPFLFSHSLTQAHTHPLLPTHEHANTRTHTHNRSRSHTNTHTLSLCLSLTHASTYTHNCSPSCSPSWTHSQVRTYSTIILTTKPLTVMQQLGPSIARLGPVGRVDQVYADIGKALEGSFGVPVHRHYYEGRIQQHHQNHASRYWGAQPANPGKPGEPANTADPGTIHGDHPFNTVMPNQQRTQPTATAAPRASLEGLNDFHFMGAQYKTNPWVSRCLCSEPRASKASRPTSSLAWPRHGAVHEQWLIASHAAGQYAAPADYASDVPGVWNTVILQRAGRHPYRSRG